MDATMAMVVIDHNGRTAILIRQTQCAVHVVEMAAGELVLRRMTEEEFAGRGFRTLDYPLARALATFAQHAGGVSEAARAALEAAREQCAAN